MRKREKQRIFKRFMEGERLPEMCLSTDYSMYEVEQAIRECVWDVIGKGEKK